MVCKGRDNNLDGSEGEEETKQKILDCFEVDILPLL